MPAVIELPGPDHFTVEVRGESFHMQDVLAAAWEMPHESHDGRLRSEIRVLLRREPHNQYDPNAIVVLSVSAKELGHVAREQAAKYAPVFDSVAGLTEVQCAGCVWGRLIEHVGWRAGVWLALPSPSELEDAFRRR